MPFAPFILHCLNFTARLCAVDKLSAQHIFSIVAFYQKHPEVNASSSKTRKRISLNLNVLSRFGAMSAAIGAPQYLTMPDPVFFRCCDGNNILG